MLSIKNITLSINDIPSTWIFNHYCNLSQVLTGQTIRIKSVFNSADKDPSMLIYLYNDTYFFNDFSSGKKGNGILLVSMLFNISTAQATVKIITDYSKCNDINITPTKCDVIKHCVSDYEIRKWKIKDKNYWSAYYISSKQLVEDNIKPLLWYKVTKYKNSNIIKSFIFKRNIIYGFFTKDDVLYKIYNPKLESDIDRKFIKVKNHIQGIDLLKYNTDTLIITSSMKDRRCLLNLKLNIESIAANSENDIIKLDTINYLKSRYHNIYVIFDNDVAGQNGAKQYTTKYGIRSLQLNGEKDIAETVKKYGLCTTRSWLKPLINI